MSQVRTEVRCVWSGLAVVAAVASAVVAPASADLGVGLQPVWGPDVYGGYDTSHVIVQIAPDFVPAWKLEQGAAVGFGVAQVDQVLAQWHVQSIAPATPGGFANPQSAARIGLDRYFRINVPQGTDTPALADTLRQFHDVFTVAEIAGVGGVADTIPNDTFFNNLWGMHNTGQFISACGSGTPDADIDAPAAWDIFTGTSDVILAVIDSGVDNHVDLAGKILPGHNSVNGSTDVSDTCQHGTHVAGTAGANGNNALGVVGVSWGVLIQPVKVLTGCFGNTTDCANGIIWAVDNGADIGTMSLQYYTFSSFFEDSTEYAHDNGVLLVAATGNTAAPGTIAWPAKFPLVLAVGATNNQDAHAWFSNTGAEIDVSAPGECVYSSLGTSSYAYYDGTSMATPHVSGLASLIWSFNRTLTHDDVAQIIKDTCDDKGAVGWDTTFGWGRINAHEAMMAAGGDNTGCPGDCNGDNIINQADLVCWKELLLAGDPAADCNGDGMLNGQDFLCLRQLMKDTIQSGGCP